MKHNKILLIIIIIVIVIITIKHKHHNKCFALLVNFIKFLFIKASWVVSVVSSHYGMTMNYFPSKFGDC